MEKCGWNVLLIGLLVIILSGLVSFSVIYAFVGLFQN